MQVDVPSHGMLQDVHWSIGLFGYFPTYTLGNVYAGCLHQALRKQLPELDQSLAQGSAKPATDWLHDGVHRHGGLYRPADVVRTCLRIRPDGRSAAGLPGGEVRRDLRGLKRCKASLLRPYGPW